MSLKFSLIVGVVLVLIWIGVYFMWQIKVMHIWGKWIVTVFFGVLSVILILNLLLGALGMGNIGNFQLTP